VEIPVEALTILSGLNGMGKSSVLQSLLLLRQSRPVLPLAQPRVRLTLNGELAKLGTASDVLYEGANDDKISFTLAFRDGSKTSWSFRYGNPDANVLVGEVEPADSRHLREPLFRSGGFHYLQAERTGPRTFFPASESDLIRRRELGPRGEHTAYFLAIYGEQEIHLKSLAHPKAASLTLRDQVEAWMGELSPGTRIHLTPYKDIDLVSLRYSFVEREHVTNPYRSTNVGFGLTYTLPVIVALLSSPPDRSLVLLENPEAHLHPRGQSKLGEFLARAAAAGAQVIAETHSDHILNGIRIAVRKELIDPSKVKLHFLERLGDSDHQMSSTVKTPRMDKDGRLDYWPEGFFDEWDRNLEALLDNSDQ
jgi:predicted ATPase